MAYLTTKGSTSFLSILNFIQLKRQTAMPIKPKINNNGTIIAIDNCNNPNKSGNQNGAVSSKKTIAANSTMKSNTSLY